MIYQENCHRRGRAHLGTRSETRRSCHAASQAEANRKGQGWGTGRECRSQLKSRSMTRVAATSRRRLAQKAASMIASVAAVSGAVPVWPSCRVGEAATCRAKWSPIRAAALLTALSRTKATRKVTVLDERGSILSVMPVSQAIDLVMADEDGYERGKGTRRRVDSIRKRSRPMVWQKSYRTTEAAVCPPSPEYIRSRRTNDADLKRLQ